MHSLSHKYILSAILLSIVCCLCMNRSSLPVASAKGAPVDEAATQPEAAASDSEEAIASGYSNSITYYSQGDPSWASYPYGGSDPMDTYGCGPTALAIAITSLTGNPVTPVEMADWSSQNGCFSKGHGSAHDLIPNGAKAYGLTVEKLSVLTPESIRTVLSYHKLIVFLMGPGEFADSGHFIVAYGYLADGTIQIADPASIERSSRSWAAEEIIAQVLLTAKAGGPAWVLSK